MNVDTDTFSAITAESAMLRERAQRAAPGRHQRPRKPLQPGQRGPERGLDRWWRAGYAAAMGDILAVMGEAAEHAEALAGDEDARRGRMVTAGGQADRLRATVLSAVLAVAEHATEVYETDTVPADWTAGDGPR